MPEHLPGPTASRGVYGFAMHLTFQTCFILFVIWAAIPEKWFNYIGITYVPQRYWAVAVPIFILTVIAVFAFVIYPSLGLIITPDIDSMDTITDPHANYTTEETFANNVIDRKVPCICRNQTFCMKHIYDTMDAKMIQRNAIPPIKDIHISKVSEDLYL